MKTEELDLIKELGFIYSMKSKLFEKESDDGLHKDYLILKEYKFYIERELYLYEDDGSFYVDYYKILPEDGVVLTEFIKNY
jgi:hypothetical protein